MRNHELAQPRRAGVRAVMVVLNSRGQVLEQALLRALTRGLPHVQYFGAISDNVNTMRVLKVLVRHGGPQQIADGDGDHASSGHRGMFMFWMARCLVASPRR